MIDLHLHLDGSLDKKDFLYLANKDHVLLPDNFPRCLYVAKNCPSLEEYLEKFNLPLVFMQTKENLRYITRSLVNRLYKMGYIYAEIRFASQLHTEKGLSQVEVLKSVLEGLKEGLTNKVNFDCNLIICMMRQAPYEVNKETLDAVKEVNSHKIVAIDLAGPEAFKPTKDYKDLFDLAIQYGFNITIHAGEACGNESITEAIDLGAKRIGHGVHLAFDKNTLKKVHEHHTYFEFCPTSNLQTKSLKKYVDVPLINFKEHGIPVCINSDNMTVSHTDVLHEFRYLYKAFNLTKDEVKEYLLNSVNAAFISDKQKSLLTTLVNQKIDDYYSKIIKKK